MLRALLAAKSHTGNPMDTISHHQRRGLHAAAVSRRGGMAVCLALNVEMNPAGDRQQPVVSERHARPAAIRVLAHIVHGIGGAFALAIKCNRQTGIDGMDSKQRSVLFMYNRIV